MLVNVSFKYDNNALIDNLKKQKLTWYAKCDETMSGE